MKRYSKSERKIIAFLQKRTKEEYHVNEIIRSTDLLPRSVSLAINKLENRRLIKSRRVGNLRLISLNEEVFLSTYEPDRQYQKVNGNKQKQFRSIILPAFSINISYMTIKSVKDMLVQDDAGSEMFFISGEFNTLLIKESSHINIKNSLEKLIGEIESTFHRDFQDIDAALKRHQQSSEYLRQKTNSELSEIIEDIELNTSRVAFYLIAGNLLNEIIKDKAKSTEGGQNLIELSKPNKTYNYEYLSLLKIIQRINEWATYNEIREMCEEHQKQYWYWSDLAKDDYNIFELIENLSSREKYPKQRIEEINNTSIGDRNNNQLDSELIQANREIPHIQYKVYSLIARSTYIFNKVFIEALNRFEIPKDCHKFLTSKDLLELLSSNNPIDKSEELIEKIGKRNELVTIKLSGNEIEIIDGQKDFVEEIIKSGFYKSRINGKSLYPGKFIGYVDNSTKCNIKSRVIFDNNTTRFTKKFTIKTKGLITTSDNIESGFVQMGKNRRIPSISGINNPELIQDGDLVVIDGQKGISYLIDTNKDTSFQWAYQRNISGYIKVNDISSESKNDKNILVLKSVRPDMLPIILKSQGMIIEDGGSNSLGYFYSHMLKIPAIIGYKGATRIFGEGDYIELYDVINQPASMTN